MMPHTYFFFNILQKLNFFKFSTIKKNKNSVNKHLKLRKLQVKQVLLLIEKVWKKVAIVTGDNFLP